MERFIIEMLVANHTGVLHQITGLYSRRGYNIDSLVVHETKDKNISIMRIASLGDEKIQNQMVSQLRKLYDVKAVQLLKTIVFPEITTPVLQNINTKMKGQ